MEDLERQVLACLTNAIIQERNYHPERLAPHITRFIESLLSARAAAEREKIKVAALTIRADYPEDLFPTLPAAAGARLAIDRLLDALD